MKDDLKSEYENIKRYMKLNEQLKKRVVATFKNVKSQLDVTIRRRELTKAAIVEANNKNFVDVLPIKNYDFIGQERS